MKQLREENARLKRVVADLTLDKVMLQDGMRLHALANGACMMAGASIVVQTLAEAIGTCVAPVVRDAKKATVVQCG